MGDVIELSSSDDEEIKGIKRKSTDELEKDDDKEKRLKLSPFKSDTIIIDDEDQDLGITENDANIPNITQENGKVNNNDSKQPSDDEMIDLTTQIPAVNGNDNHDETSEDEEQPSSSKPTEVDEKTQRFLNKCEELFTNATTKSKFREKVPIFKKCYLRASKYVVSKEYEDLIEEKLKQVESGSAEVALLFTRVYRTLESNCDVSPVNKRMRRLENMLAKLNKKIKDLEEAEVDFDDEENSSYLQLQRYKERAFKVFVAIKRIEKDDPNKGRLYYGRIDFATSSHPEINSAISKYYQDREKRPFPTFEGVDKCIRQTVKKHNLKFSDIKLKMEVSKCFTALGKLLQQKRKLDLASVHFEYLGEVIKDPADKDPELNKKLVESSQVFHSNMERVVAKYETMQTEGISATLSTDSDDSNKPDSEESETD